MLNKKNKPVVEEDDVGTGANVTPVGSGVDIVGVAGLDTGDELGDAYNMQILCNSTAYFYFVHKHHTVVGMAGDGV